MVPPAGGASSFASALGEEGVPSCGLLPFSASGELHFSLNLDLSLGMGDELGEDDEEEDEELMVGIEDVSSDGDDDEEEDEPLTPAPSAVYL